MKNNTKTLIALIALIIIIIGFIYVYKNINQPVATEDFAKCLASKSIVYSSSICPHCQEQKKIIGPNYKYINEIDCYTNPEECVKANVTGTPTWIINGNRIEGVQTLAQLEQLSGCQCNLTPENASCTSNISAICSVNSSQKTCNN